MQSYQEIMKQDLALAKFCDEFVKELTEQTQPEPLIDKAYQHHKKRRQLNKRVNLAFNRLAFSVKQQISEDRKGERHGNVD